MKKTTPNYLIHKSMIFLNEHKLCSGTPNDILAVKLAHELRPHLANLQGLCSMIKNGDSNDVIMRYFEKSIGKLDESLLDVLDLVWQMEKSVLTKGEAQKI